MVLAGLLKLCSVLFLLHGTEKQSSQIHFFPMQNAGSGKEGNLTVLC